METEVNHIITSYRRSRLQSADIPHRPLFLVPPYKSRVQYNLDESRVVMTELQAEGGCVSRTSTNGAARTVCPRRGNPLANHGARNPAPGSRRPPTPLHETQGSKPLFPRENTDATWEGWRGPARIQARQFNQQRSNMRKWYQLVHKHKIGTRVVPRLRAHSGDKLMLTGECIIT